MMPLAPIPTLDQIKADPGTDAVRPPQSPGSGPPHRWLCARCGDKPFTGGPGDIAAHLIDEHALPAMTALREARGESKHPSTKETPAMPTGVYPRRSDPTKPCGRCKRPKDNHATWCTVGQESGKKQRQPIARKDKPTIAATNGADPIATIRGALDQLEVELIRVRALRVELAKVLGQ